MSLHPFEETWRWFGPDDPVTLADIRQTGASGIVTALHHLPNGAVWSRDDITARQAMIAAAGLTWSVVESIPVHEDIKTAAPGWEALADAWAESAENLAACGIGTICYNFMPVIDWTRTDLACPMPDGALALRFDAVDCAVFDAHILARRGALDGQPALAAAAAARFAGMDAAARTRLADTILAGLPGAEESYDVESFRARLAAYAGIDANGLRANLAAFLARVMPRVEAAGARLAIHPDDPPWPLFGLPRVVSTAADMDAIAGMWPGPACGFTFCTGSYGARADNDLPAMIRAHGPRIHFAHLRSVTRDADGAGFHEAAHLEGSSDMLAVLAALMDVAGNRAPPLPFRPDHGQAMLSDLSGRFRPGYPAIGRLRGLAELRGAAAALWRHRAPA